MNIFGWIFLLSSWAVIIGLLVFCFGKIFTEKEEEL
jgi:protein-S-isoprenylcysteine O-methyltransferase Ste14